MFIAAPAIIRAAVRSATRIQLTSDNRTSGQREFTSTSRAFYVKVAVPMQLPDAGRLRE